MAENQTRDDTPREMHEINVTPMIDVMLVLLIIFMVAAPLATIEIPMAPPALAAPAAAGSAARPLVLTLRPDGGLALAGRSFDVAGLAEALDTASGGDRSRAIYLLADGTLPYGEVMRVMNGVRDRGYGSVSLVALEER